MSFVKILKFWFPVIGYSGIIYYVSSIPDMKVPGPGGNIDKIIHVFEYMPFGYLIARALGGSDKPLLPITLVLGVTVLTFLYGLSDEFHQIFVVGRSSSLWDVVADTVGGCLGAWIYVQHRQIPLLQGIVKERGC